MSETRLITRDFIVQVCEEGGCAYGDDVIDEYWNSLPMLSDVRECLEHFTAKESDNKTNLFCYGEKCSRCSWKTIDCNNTFSFDLSQEYTKAKAILEKIGG